MLKLTPLLGLGGFAVPGVGKQMLERTREWSARGFETLRSEGKLAPVFARHEATPLEHFPVNSYLTDDPEVDAKEWRLTVSGAVERPGEYTLDRVKALPRVEQTTRHVCIEGWPAIGVFGGMRGSLSSSVPTTTTNSWRFRRRCIRKHSSATKCMVSR